MNEIIFDQLIALRMDKKLAVQLIKYAKKNHRGNRSKAAREAIRQFLNK